MFIEQTDFVRVNDLNTSSVVRRLVGTGRAVTPLLVRGLLGLLGPLSRLPGVRAGLDLTWPRRRSAQRKPLPRPVPRHWARCSRPFVASKPGCRRQAPVSRVLFEGALVGSVTRWPLLGRKKTWALDESVAHSRRAVIGHCESLLPWRFGRADLRAGIGRSRSVAR